MPDDPRSDRHAVSLIKGIRGEHHSNLLSGIYIQNRHWEDHRFTTTQLFTCSGQQRLAFWSHFWLLDKSNMSTYLTEAISRLPIKQPVPSLSWLGQYSRVCDQITYARHQKSVILLCYWMLDDNMDNGIFKVPYLKDTIFTTPWWLL